MDKESSESRGIKVKKLSIQNNDFSPNEMICVDDFEELSDIFKDESIVLEKFKFIRKIIKKKK